MEAVFRSVTRSAIKEARLKELRLEMVNSSKLRAHFEDNPRELALLKHAKVLRPNNVVPALKHIPKYLMPKNAKTFSSNLRAAGSDSGRRGQKRSRRHTPNVSSKMSRKRADPLKTFKYDQKRKFFSAAAADKSDSAKRRQARQAKRRSGKRR